ncbi:uncharacterized protein LOC133730506 [Rosa rugosa]|uniref:uncharacterized protein LOC133730506 n=1 Tax=Rosa rugosa TaxID=74645 RepID=UPI002B4179CB|nr:uncharacterized protein LOC133730506 [Rosa rugosa]
MDDLPDLVKVEILCRLPCKYVVRCKCLSKHWLTLISDSDPYFVSRFQCLLGPERTLLFSPTPKDRFTMNELSGLKTLGSFRPSFQPNDHQSNLKPIVVATCNDLVLCCKTPICIRREYFICNPYTRQFVSLPIAPPSTPGVSVGFINCDSDHKKEQTTGGNSNITGYKVVQIPYFGYDTAAFQFKVDIFSFKTGEWRDYLVSCQLFRFQVSNRLVSSQLGSRFQVLNRAGIAYNGVLYWSGPNGFLIGIDPFNPKETTGSRSSGDIIEHKYGYFIGFNEHLEPCIDLLDQLDVSHGSCLRPCQLYRKQCILRVWELKEVQEEQLVNQGNSKWCLTYKVSLEQIVWQDQKIDLHCKGSKLLALDPNNDDVLYLKLDGQIVICNIRTSELKIAKLLIINYSPWPYNGVFPFVFPSWPTPVPKLPPQKE